MPEWIGVAEFIVSGLAAILVFLFNNQRRANARLIKVEGETASAYGNPPAMLRDYSTTKDIQEMLAIMVSKDRLSLVLEGYASKGDMNERTGGLSAMEVTIAHIDKEIQEVKADVKAIKNGERGR